MVKCVRFVNWKLFDVLLKRETRNALLREISLYKMTDYTYLVLYQLLICPFHIMDMQCLAWLFTSLLFERKKIDFLYVSAED